MNEIIDFEDLSLSDKIDIFVQQISGHENESEINLMLALFTAHKMNYETAEECGLGEHTTEELIEIFNTWLNEDEFKTTEMFWDIVIKDLGTVKIFDIIENIDNYMRSYHRLLNPLKDLKGELLSIFVKLN